MSDDIAADDIAAALTKQALLDQEPGLRPGSGACPRFAAGPAASDASQPSSRSPSATGWRSPATSSRSAPFPPVGATGDGIAAGFCPVRPDGEPPLQGGELITVKSRQHDQAADLR